MRRNIGGSAHVQTLLSCGTIYAPWQPQGVPTPQNPSRYQKKEAEAHTKLLLPHPNESVSPSLMFHNVEVQLLEWVMTSSRSSEASPRLHGEVYRTSILQDKDRKNGQRHHKGLCGKSLFLVGRTAQLNTSCKACQAMHFPLMPTSGASALWNPQSVSPTKRSPPQKNRRNPAVSFCHCNLAPVSPCSDQIL